MITFYEPEDENGWLCSLSPHPITIDNVTWPTAEHYYQSRKFTAHPALQEQIRTAPDARAAKAIAKTNKVMARPDWNDVKVEEFYAANLAKFTQHADLRAALLATGDAELVEQSPHDAFWGRNADGIGQNMVGVTLMCIRATLRNG